MIKRKARKIRASDYGAPPKPAHGSYFMWTKANRQRVTQEVSKELKAQGKSFSLPAVGKRMAELYRKDVTEEDKAKLRELAQDTLKKYNQAYSAWRQTDNYKRFMDARKEAKEKKKTQKDKQLARDAGLPIRPPSAYFLYLNEQRPKLEPSMKAEYGDEYKPTMLTSICSKNWKKLDEEAKRPFHHQTAELRKVHAIKMKEWRESEICARLQSESTIAKRKIEAAEKLQKEKEKIVKKKEREVKREIYRIKRLEIAKKKRDELRAERLAANPELVTIRRRRQSSSSSTKKKREEKQTETLVVNLELGTVRRKRRSPTISSMRRVRVKKEIKGEPVFTQVKIEPVTDQDPNLDQVPVMNLVML